MCRTDSDTKLHTNSDKEPGLPTPLLKAIQPRDCSYEVGVKRLYSRCKKAIQPPGCIYEVGVKVLCSRPVVGTNTV